MSPNNLQPLLKTNQLHFLKKMWAAFACAKCAITILGCCFTSLLKLLKVTVKDKWKLILWFRGLLKSLNIMSNSKWINTHTLNSYSYQLWSRSSYMSSSDSYTINKQQHHRHCTSYCIKTNELYIVSFCLLQFYSVHYNRTVLLMISFPFEMLIRLQKCLSSDMLCYLKHL